jgi:hypothetical protein
VTLKVGKRTASKSVRRGHGATLTLLGTGLAYLWRRD